MSVALEPEEGPGAAEGHGFWARVRRVLKTLGLVAKLVYYTLAVWREL